MPQENVESAKNFLAAFNRRDIPAMVDMSTGDYEFTPLTAGTLESTVYRGHEGIAAYFRDAEAAWQTITMEPQEFRDLGDSVLVIAILRGRGRGSGVDVELPFFGVLMLRGHKFAAGRAFSTKEEALEAVGRSE